MSHTQTKLSVSFRHLVINSSIVFLSLVSVVFFSSFQRESSLNKTSQTKSLMHSSPLKGKLVLSLNGNGEISGNGVGTHLGRFDFLAHDDESGFPFITGTVVITAANGDQIFATHSGTVRDLGNGILEIPLQHTITGGTGRFSGASGDFLIVSIANINIGMSTGIMNGSISY